MKNEFSGLVNNLTNYIGNADDEISRRISCQINQAVMLWSMGRLLDGVNLLREELSRVTSV